MTAARRPVQQPPPHAVLAAAGASLLCLSMLWLLSLWLFCDVNVNVTVTNCASPSGTQAGCYPAPIRPDCYCWAAHAWL